MKVRVKLAGVSEIVESTFAVRLLEVVTVPMTIERPAVADEAEAPAAPAQAYTGKRRGRKPKAAVEALALVPKEGEEAVSEVERTPDEPQEAPKAEGETAPTEPPKRRGRPPKAKPEGETPEPKKEASPAEKGKSDVLLQRFTRLVDKDYDAASDLLEKFGIDRFSQLPEAKYSEFSVALVEAGV